MCCISPWALLSTVVTRLRAGGRTSAEELRAIVGSGFPLEQIAEVLGRETGPTFDEALALLDEVRRTPPERRYGASRDAR